MPAKFWTEERLAELRRLYLLETPRKKIAKHFGVSITAISVALSKYGISSKARAAANRSRLLRGRKRSPEVVAIMRENSKARWQRPDFWRKMAPHLDRMSSPEFREKAAAKQRGYSMTPQERADRDLMRKKHLTAAEIREALGK